MEIPDFALRRAAVVGLGLMGGSLALALRGRCEVWGMDADPAVSARAAEQGLIARVVSLPEALAADLLVLAAPVRAILDVLAELGNHQPPRPLVVLDLGSTKTAIVQAMQILPEGYEPIGGHPMCGKETSGLAAAEAGLYTGRTFILCRLARTTPRAEQMALGLTAALGAHPLWLEAETQDALAARISHLPYLAAVALVQAAQAANDPRVWQVAAGGFRDTTRLAASDVGMLLDILLTNRAPVLAALADFRASLGRLEQLVAAADEPGLRAALTQTRALKQQAAGRTEGAG